MHYVLPSLAGKVDRAVHLRTPDRMIRSLSVTSEAWPLQRAFRIARGAKTQAVVVTVTIQDGKFFGRGECVPYARYDESEQSARGEPCETKRPNHGSIPPMLPGSLAESMLFSTSFCWSRGITSNHTPRMFACWL